MILLNPKHPDHPANDASTNELMRQTIEFFEAKGKTRLLRDYYDRGWYADFLDHAKQHRLLAKMCTPAGEGAPDARWDTWRVCQFAEILGFYGLQYWYTWQVSVLGLGPIWMSENEGVRKRTSQALEDGGIFAFGLSEKTHGADIYSTDMVLTPDGDGWKANGRKYYIGNGNEAAIVSTFGRFDGSDEYVFFASDPKHENYHLIQNVVSSQNYVSEFELKDYPVSEADILHRGRDAWNAALNTVNIGKYNLGWASIGICTHALYEAITHANNRVLYGAPVTDMSHVRKMFVDAYCRLVAMKLFALRASDYMRTASREDRRYLLYNPMVKMKVTTQGEDVINLLWDAIAAKGFEKSTYFGQAASRHSWSPEARGHRPREHRADREVHGQLLLQPGRVPRGRTPERGRATTTSCSTRAVPVASARSSSTTTAETLRALRPNRERALLQRAGRGLPPAPGQRPAGPRPDEGRRLPAGRRQHLRSRRLRPADPRERTDLRDR